MQNTTQLLTACAGFVAAITAIVAVVMSARQARYALQSTRAQTELGQRRTGVAKLVMSLAAYQHAINDNDGGEERLIEREFEMGRDASLAFAVTSVTWGPQHPLTVQAQIALADLDQYAHARTRLYDEEPRVAGSAAESITETIMDAEQSRQGLAEAAHESLSDLARAAGITF